MYAGDEYYSDDVTSPLERPMPPMRPITRTPKRVQVKRARRELRQYRPAVYAEIADLYGDESEVK